MSFLLGSPRIGVKRRPMVRLGSPGTPAEPEVPFAPEDLGTKLLAWWDVEEASTLTLSGNQITEWRDKVTGTGLVQGVGGSRPVYNATAFNGRPAAVFDGIDDYLSIASVFLPTGTDDCEIRQLTDPPTGAADTVTRISFSYGDGSAASGDRRMRRQVVSGVSRHSPVFGLSLTATDTEYAGPCMTYMGCFDGTLQEVKLGQGGQLFTQAVTASTMTARTIIGSRSNVTPGNYWLGPLNSIIVTSELTAGERTQLETYLAGRL